MIFTSKEAEEYYRNIIFICPLCKTRSDGIGHVYNELRICDDCYCDIFGMTKVNENTVYNNFSMGEDNYMAKVSIEFETLYDVGNIVIFKKDERLLIGIVEGYYSDTTANNSFWYNIRVNENFVYAYSNGGDIAEWDIICKIDQLLPPEINEDIINYITGHSHNPNHEEFEGSIPKMLATGEGGKPTENDNEKSNEDNIKSLVNDLIVERIIKLNSCSTCVIKGCTKRPKLGEPERINCFLYEGKDLE